MRTLSARQRRSVCTLKPSAPEKVDPIKIEKAVREVFDLRPLAIINELDLRRPIYKKTAAHGHFGRTEPEFTWERLNRVDALRSAVSSSNICQGRGAR